MKRTSGYSSGSCSNRLELPVGSRVSETVPEDQTIRTFDVLGASLTSSLGPEDISGGVTPQSDWEDASPMMILPKRSSTFAFFEDAPDLEQTFQPRLTRNLSAPADLDQQRVSRRKIGASGKRIVRGNSWESHKRSLEMQPEDKVYLHDTVQEHHVCAMLSGSVVDAIVDNMSHFSFEAGEVLIKQGDIGQYFFVVHDGLLEVEICGKGVVNCMGRGESFGGSALLFDGPQPTTVIAKEASTIWAIDGISFRSVLTANAKSFHEENYKLLDSVQLFDGLTAQQKARVGDLALFTEVHEAGARVVTEGEQVTAMYFVRAGELCAFSGGQIDLAGNLNGGTKVATLKVGDSFAKSAALYKQKKSKVSVVAETRCELVCMGVKQMKEAFGDDLIRGLENMLILECLEKSPFLSQFSTSQKFHIVRRMEIVNYNPGDEIEEGTLDFAVVLKGKLFNNDEEGTIFLQEKGLLEASTNPALVKKRSSRSLSSSKSPSLRGQSTSFATFEEGLKAGPKGARVALLSMERLESSLKEIGISRASEDTMEHARKMLLANRVPLFHHLSPEQVDSIVESFIAVRTTKGAIVFQQGSAATEFWVVASGEFEERIDDEVVRVFGKNGHFGVRALLTGERRRGTVRCSSDEGELWQLEGETFKEIVSGDVRDALLHDMELRSVNVQLTDLHHVRVIGVGGFGSVRMVEHRRANLRYALKRVRKQSVQGQLTEMLQRECALLAEFDHPLILTLVKMLETSNSIYILTELLTGGELLDVLNNLARPLKAWEAQFYAGSLVLVLDFLHDRGVVFRDLKPENVMLDGRGYIKLIDFGTAKKLENADLRTFTMIGSYHFMAPEIPRGRGYSTEVDIWSLGVMMFEFVCGYLPFGHDLSDPTGLEIIREAQTKNLCFPEWYHDGTCKAVIRGMLRREPERRLGAGSDGYRYIREHSFFAVEGPISLFDQILGRALQPPYLPEEETYGPDDGAALSDADVFA